MIGARRPRVSSRAGLALVCIAIGMLSGACGHGRYVSRGISLAQQRQAQLKSGTEWSMAHQAFLAGDLDKAMKRVDRSLALNPDVPKAHVLKGRILVEQSRLGPALESFDAAGTLDPEHVEAFYYQGVVLERLQRPADAFLAFDRAATLDPSNAQHAIAAAEALIDQGRVGEARAYLERSASRFEHNPGVRHTLGHIALLQGEFDLAIRLFRETVLLAPDDPGVVEDLVDAQIAAGRIAQAERRLADLLAREDYAERRDLHHLRVRCLVELDRLVEARQALLELTSAPHGQSDAEAWIALARVSLSLGRPPELKRAADRVVAIASDRHEGYLYQAMWHRIRGEHRAALMRLAAATRQAPDRPEILMVRAFILQDLGHDRRALAHLRRAAELDPDNTRIAGLIDALEQSAAYAGVPTGE